MRKQDDATQLRFTSADLEAFPDDGKRYEIIDGELYVSKQPHAYHQVVCTLVWSKLKQRSDQSGDGMALIAPGLIFADDDGVAVEAQSNVPVASLGLRFTGLVFTTLPVAVVQ